MEYDNLPEEERARIENSIDDFLSTIKSRFEEAGLDTDWEVLDVLYSGSYGGGEVDEYTTDYDVLVLTSKVILYPKEKKRAIRKILSDYMDKSLTVFGTSKKVQFLLTSPEHVYDWRNTETPTRVVGVRRKDNKEYLRKDEVLKDYA